MFSLVDRDEWPGPPAIEQVPAKVFLGDISRAVAVGKDKLLSLSSAANCNEASTKMLKHSIEYLERMQAQGKKVVTGLLNETKYPNVSFTEDGSGRKLHLHKLPSAIRHAAFEGVSGDASNETQTCYSLDMTWAAQQLYVWLNKNVLGKEIPSARKRRAAIGGYRGYGSLDNHYKKGKEYTRGSVRATNMWFNARLPPVSNAYLWLTFVERYRIILGLLCKDCGATSPEDLLRLCGCTEDVKEFVKGVPIRLAEVLDDIDPHNIPADLQEYIGIDSSGFCSKLAYADPVAVILTAYGHVGSSHGYASSHLATWKSTSNQPYGYYQFEDIIMLVEENLQDVITSTPGQGKLGVLNALSSGDRELSGNIQVFLDTVRLFLIRHVVHELRNLQCTLSFINGDGIYFYASSNLANELAQVLPEGVAFTLEYHSGGPACEKSCYWIQERMAITRAVVPCSHRYADEVQSPEKRRRKLKNDIDFSSCRAQDFGDRRLGDLTFDEVVGQINEDWEIGEEDKLPSTMPFVRLCKIVAASYNLVSVQRCYITAGVKKTTEEPHVSGLHGHDYHLLSPVVTTANMVIPIASGSCITFQLLMQGNYFDSSWQQPFERLLSSTTSHKALEAKFVAWGQQGRPVIDTESVRDAHLGPDFVIPTIDDYYVYGSHLPDVESERRIYPIVLSCNSEASSPEWPYYTVGRTYKIFCDANFDTAKVRDFEEELRDFFQKSAGFTHEAWGSLLPIALSAIRRTDLIADYFLVSEADNGCFEILKDDFGELCRRPVSEEAIGLRGKSVAVPQLLVKYLTGDAADELDTGYWDDLLEDLDDIMDKYPKGKVRYDS